MLKFYLFFVTALFLILPSFGQGVKVQGVVTDSNSGGPLAGVSVLEEGTLNGVLTDTDGKFSITVGNAASSLKFSFIGYETREETVNNRTVINVSLKEDVKLMDEVVVVGYGTSKRKDLTGSIASISGNDIDNVPVPDITSALAGRAAGVQVSAPEGAPGSDISIRVRGGGSITQSNEPLYIVDGFPQTDGIAYLDPTDIKSIDILKDASATAIYGARGANGVVLITTRKGVSGPVRVHYDMYYGWKEITKEIKMLNPYDYVQLEYERSINSSEDDLNKFINRYGSFSELKGLYQGRKGIDWQKEVFGQKAITQYHKISASGGNDQTQFDMFYSVNNDDGVMINSGEKKNVVKLGVDHASSNGRMKLSGVINYTDRKIHGVGTNAGQDRFNKLTNILRYRPTIGKNGNDEDLVDLDEDPALVDDAGNVLQNPKVNALAETHTRTIKNLYMNGALQFNILDNLFYRGMIGLRNRSLNEKIYNGSRSMNAKRSGGPNGSIASTDGTEWTYSNTLNYNNTFNKEHKLEALIGQEQIFTGSEFFQANASGFPGDKIGLNDLSQATMPGIPQSLKESENMISFFGRVNYGYKERYLLTASFRADGSSKFGSGNKFGYFPSVALAWRAIEENFLKGNNLISDLKFRLSYGESGNNRIPNYLSLALLGSGYYPLNHTPVTSVGSRNLPNPKLKWETTQSFNLGLDFGILKDHLHMTVDLYNNKTRDLLLNTEVPYTSGYATMQMNIGSTRNRGIELSLSTINIEKKNLEWTTNFNISFNKNEILNLNKGQDFYLTSANYGTLNESDYIVQVGSPVGLIYGYRSDGLYQVDDFDYDPASKTYTLKDGIATDPNFPAQPGFLKLQDTNGDGLITADDRVVIGNTNPRFFGGLNNTFKYKGFDLSVFVNWVVGNKVYNANKLQNSQTNLNYNNTLEYTKNRWKSIDEEGQIITDPQALAAINKGKTVPVFNSAGDIRLYDTFIEDGSFLRLNNISLGYNIPKAVLKNIKINSFRIYASIYNLATLTGYSGYDPEVNSRAVNGVTPGVDFGAYPRSKSFVFGANISF